MSGCPGKEQLLKCSTYMNQGKGECRHNWVEGRTIQSSALEGVRRTLGEAGQRERLAIALRETLSETTTVKTASPDERRVLEARLAEVTEMRRRAYLERLAPDPSLREDAEATWRRIDDEACALRKPIRSLRPSTERAPTDLDAGIEACLQLLEDLDLNLHLVPPDGLHAVLDALGVVVVLEFEQRKVRRR
ncbi:MAG: hypothetical protein CMJ84_06965 [Planctomycetes bacterium]|jgi:hypothetical protein|nr:hypothetical protein [Planctomycetota bacterium]MDP6408268.1 hypothetical protein [Planctomycetota bacterium]